MLYSVTRIKFSDIGKHFYFQLLKSEQQLFLYHTHTQLVQWDNANFFTPLYYVFCRFRPGVNSVFFCFYLFNPVMVADLWDTENDNRRKWWNAWKTWRTRVCAYKTWCRRRVPITTTLRCNTRRRRRFTIPCTTAAPDSTRACWGTTTCTITTAITIIITPRCRVRRRCCTTNRWKSLREVRMYTVNTEFSFRTT